MPFTLRFEAPPALSGTSVKLETETFIGRADGCGLRIDDAKVGRRHARLSLEAGRLVIEDLGSPHGTVVNGLRVARQELQPGDLLMLGKHRLRVEREGSFSPPRVESSAGVVKPVVAALTPPLEGLGREAFYQALGLGDETLLDAGPRAAAVLLQKTRQFAVLHEVSQALRGAHSPRGMLGRLLELVLEVTEGDRGFVVLAVGVSEAEGREEDETLPPADADRLAFRVEAVKVRGEEDRRGPPTLSSTVARHVLAERCAVLSNDPTFDARFSASESLFLNDTRALMAVPILLRDEVLGALVVESTRASTFSEADLDLLTVISSTVGQTLENLRLAERRERIIRELREAQSKLLATREKLVRSEQLAAIGRLASGLAHEVKNHLSPFMLADMIARKYPEDSEIQAAAEMMLEARQHILDLVSEVKGFARGADGAPARREPTDLLALARAVARFASCDAAVKRHRLSVVAAGEPWAELDVARIRQVIINLVKNAADAIGEARQGNIILRLAESEGFAMVEVEDDGPGIPPELGERVFEAFFSTKGDKGLGLGLDISRKIARAHGGELDFRSEPGRGTRFRLRVPALPPL